MTNETELIGLFILSRSISLPSSPAPSNTALCHHDWYPLPSFYRFPRLSFHGVHQTVKRWQIKAFTNHFFGNLFSAQYPSELRESNDLISVLSSPSRHRVCSSWIRVIAMASSRCREAICFFRVGAFVSIVSKLIQHLGSSKGRTNFLRPLSYLEGGMCFEGKWFQEESEKVLSFVFVKNTFGRHFSVLKIRLRYL